MKEYLVAFDSDGCVFDAMEVKHKVCFGPAAVSVYGLEDIESEFLDEWNIVNLYSSTRGINRFPGLITVFERMRKYGHNMPDDSSLRDWVNSTPELSSARLKEDATKSGDPILLKASQWSDEVNKLIKEKANNILPFNNAGRTIKKISEYADIAVVSSANLSAIEHEWSSNGFMEYISEFCGQERGTKSECLKMLKEKGYKKILMVGDAPGDKQAAYENDCQFYPIIPGDEENSWIELYEKAFNMFLQNIYTDEYIIKFEKICQ